MSTYRNDRNSRSRSRSGSRNSRYRRRGGRPRYDRIIGAAAIFIVLIILLVACTKSCGGDDDENQDSSPVPTEVKSSDSESDSQPSDDEAPSGNYSTISQIPNAIYEGDLVLVNTEHQYSFPPSADEKLITIYGNCSSSYQTAYLTDKLSQNVVEALNNMMDDFYQTSGINDCVVLNGFISKEEQNESYSSATEEDPDISKVPGGYSDFHTGLSFALGVMGQGYYIPEDNYLWVTENCDKYGFVLRYPKDKDSATGISYKNYIFRYVGIPHAMCMTENNLCLEEYIQFVKNYTYDGEHLKVTGPENKKYEIYYVPADPSADTSVPIPSDKTYTISGNNIDGFIVTTEL